ncbi:Carboxypeptidase regulatory-like domain-containing, partial [Paramuricea clavata]
MASTENCHVKATCTNTIGSFTCECIAGYEWNGTHCVETPPESDTETTVFDPSGNQATIPIEETVPFAVVIVIAEPFVPELRNRRSRAFGNLRRRFLGSVVADIEVLYNSTEPIPTAEGVQSPIAEARDNGSAIFNISSLQVERE